MQELTSVLETRFVDNTKYFTAEKTFQEYFSSFSSQSNFLTIISLDFSYEWNQVGGVILSANHRRSLYNLSVL